MDGRFDAQAGSTNKRPRLLLSWVVFGLASFVAVTGLFFSIFVIVMWYVATHGSHPEKVELNSTLRGVIAFLFAFTGVATCGTFFAGRSLVRQGVWVGYPIGALVVALLLLLGLISTGMFHPQN